jgi:drug/metabolite transporter (DMT)-like permease
LVPVFTVALGFPLIGEVPSYVQLAGLAVVLIGFRFTLKP